MFIAPKSGSVLLAVSLLLSGLVVYGQAPNSTAQPAPASAQAATEQKAQSLEQKGGRIASTRTWIASVTGFNPTCYFQG